MLFILFAIVCDRDAITIKKIKYLSQILEKSSKYCLKLNTAKARIVFTITDTVIFWRNEVEIRINMTYELYELIAKNLISKVCDDSFLYIDAS